jgi:hypothetical protein
MPVNLKKYDLFVYDEPAILNDFTGGINTDSNYDGIVKNEMQDCLNMDYVAGSLKKRQGVEILSKIITPEPFHFIQGIFLFTIKVPYIVIAADGKLFYGFYTPNEKITLKYLKIFMPTLETIYSQDPTNPSHGLEIKTSMIDKKIKHEGYITQDRDLIFQNIKPIEASSYLNKMYITTGTRFIEIFLEGQELKASPVIPTMVAPTEYISFGYNYLSPYPELCISTVFNQAITEIKGITIRKTIYTREGKTIFKLEPFMNFIQGETISDYCYRWEKLHNGKWVAVNTFQDNYFEEDGVVKKNTLYSIEVLDANQTNYRVTFAKDFLPILDPETEEPTETLQTIILEKIYESTQEIYEVLDWVVDEKAGFFGSAISVIYNENILIDKTFQTIQSCTKILNDGNKFLLYGDKFNSGSWYKTIISNPNFITQKGSLSFKTNKNEELIKVVQFNNNLIAFAYSEMLGGSIHMVLGAGDDIDDQYYSPYRRRTITTAITTDNANTVQVRENLLIFKYFKTIYYIRSGDLSNEVVSFFSANDRIKQDSQYISIPWDDNNCLSEVTEDYYAIIWKEKNRVENGEVIVERPATRVKMYYKMGQEIVGKIYLPWLRDESEYLNIEHILYIKGKPVYLYGNNLVSFHENKTKDIDQPIPFKIILRPTDMNYPKIFKLFHSLILTYNKSNNSNIKIDCIVRNESGYVMLDTTRKQHLGTQDLATFKVGEKYNEETKYKLDTNNTDTKIFKPDVEFPCMLAEVEIFGESTASVSFGSITINYTTIEVPNSTPYELYSKIIRKEDL